MRENRRLRSLQGGAEGLSVPPLLRHVSPAGRPVRRDGTPLPSSISCLWSLTVSLDWSRFDLPLLCCTDDCQIVPKPHASIRLTVKQLSLEKVLYLCHIHCPLRRFAFRRIILSGATHLHRRSRPSGSTASRRRGGSRFSSRSTITSASDKASSSFTYVSLSLSLCTLLLYCFGCNVLSLPAYSHSCASLSHAPPTETGAGEDAGKTDAGGGPHCLPHPWTRHVL